jgi:prophage DNA circulation protein
MNNWRERLRKGSFRDEAFHTDNASGSAGRRVALHEYPQQEVYFAEDLGKKAESERLKVFVIGADYDLARDKLMEALNKPGAGKLVHPYLGTLNIQVQDFDWTISTRQGGYCEFNIQYVRAGKITPHKPIAITSNKLSDAVKTATTKSEDTFAKNFSVSDGTAAFVEESALDKLNSVTDSLRSLNGQISGALQPISNVANGIDDFGKQVATLILQPQVLAQNLMSVVASTFGAIADIKAAFKGYDHMIVGFGNVDKPTSNKVLTTNRKQELNNTIALNRLALSASTLAAANAVIVASSSTSSVTTSTATATFTTSNEASVARDTLLTQIDALIDSDSDDEYEAWADVQANLVRLIAELEPNLATANTTQLSQSVPALVLAYSLYGDANRDAELVSRNAIANPLFMPAGVDLEVLS